MSQVGWEETQQLEVPPKEALQESDQLAEQLAPPAGHRYKWHPSTYHLPTGQRQKETFENLINFVVF